MKKIIKNILFNTVFKSHNKSNVHGMVRAPRQLNYEIQVIAENLYVPWAMDISDEGKIYFTERSGAIRIIEDGKLNPKPIMNFNEPFVSQGEGGLMGLL